MHEAQAKALARMFAGKFIARPDVKALQRANGEWYPVREPIGMGDLLDHLAGKISLGHYLLNQKDQCKFFAFDIDLEEAKPEKQIYWPLPTRMDEPAGEWVDWCNGDPRHVWMNYDAVWPLNAEQIQIDFLTYQLRSAANLLARAINEEFPSRQILVTYSGSKGVHVYCIFDEKQPATVAREMAETVLESTERLELIRGNNFYKFKKILNDEISDMPQLSVEIFPKQTTLEGKELGNLMRLPMGHNLKASKKHPYQAGFLDLRTRYTELTFRDPFGALTTSNQWAGELSDSRL